MLVYLISTVQTEELISAFNTSFLVEYIEKIGEDKQGKWVLR